MKSPAPYLTALFWLSAPLLVVSVAACEADDAVSTSTPTAANVTLPVDPYPKFSSR
jgi:hypothetical protein